MADSRISDYTEATDNESILIEVVQASSNRKMTEKTLAQVKIENKTANHILEISDAAKCIEMDVASANTLTVPPNADVAFPINTVIQVLQYGAGQTTIVAGSGVTLRSYNGLKIIDQYAGCILHKRGENEWYVIGAMEV